MNIVYFLEFHLMRIGTCDIAMLANYTKDMSTGMSVQNIRVASSFIANP